jgi:uncharacterized protein YdaU (DUF1376 family)
MNFYGFYVGDYARSTGGLSIVEHGVYRLMLDHFYGTARPLPADHGAIGRIIRAHSKDERKAVDTIAARYWKPLPADFKRLCDLLKLDLPKDQLALGAVMSEWGSDAIGGLINGRALVEIAKAYTRQQTARESALAREARKREQRQLQVIATQEAHRQFAANGGQF